MGINSYLLKNEVKEIKWNFNQLLVSVIVWLGIFDVLYWVLPYRLYIFLSPEL